jgi:DNA-binding response OmpR family regulator
MRILVVEDEHTIARSIKRGLEQETYSVDLAFDAQGGLDFGLTGSYDCIIIDWMLPGKSGLEVCKEIRANGVQTPILMLTAKGATEDKVSGLDSGADDYLTKPFAFEELLARIRALTRRSHELTPIILEGPDITLNTVRYEVRRGGELVTLSRKEFALLEYLLRNKNAIITKDQIMEHVWDFDADILPNTIEVYIGYLRQKLEKPFKLPALITTVRGFGYTIKETK